MVETLGQSNPTTLLYDMGANNDNIYSPAYAIHERGRTNSSWVLLFNPVDKASGLDVELNFAGTEVGSSVRVLVL